MRGCIVRDGVTKGTVHLYEGQSIKCICGDGPPRRQFMEMPRCKDCLRVYKRSELAGEMCETCRQKTGE